MTIAPSQSISLDEFLKLPETKPASEYVDGQIFQKPMPVFDWPRIPFDANGEIPNDFLIHPDWTIEILSPDQSSNRVTGNILHCIHDGCRLGWLLDPDDHSVLTFLPKQEPVFCEGSDRLATLEEINLELTAEQIFSWLKMVT